MAWNKLVNTQYFLESANHFQKHGCYTLAPRGHPEYVQFWQEELRRWKEGYKVGDLWISGKHYAYLNYAPMERLKTEEEYKKDSSSMSIAGGLPRFFLMDYEYWIVKDIMQNGATPERVKELNIPYLKSEGYDAGKHLAILKTRRGGFSYKESFEGVYNYTIIPGSKNFYFAATEEALVKDGIFNKVGFHLNHLDRYTEFGKLRQKVDRARHKRASYLEPNHEGQLVEKGFMSELITSVLDSADKARGKSGVKITFEEAGSFPALLDAWVICEPQVKQGGVMKGYMTAFGTGGNKKDEGLKSLEEIFNNPDTYDAMCFENIWDEDLLGTECGMFIPTTMIREQHMDVDGNIDFDAANLEIEKEREKWKQSGDSTYYDKKCAENPLNPSEALQRVNFNFFPIQDLKRQLRWCEVHNKQDLWVNGDLLYNDEGRVEFKPNPKSTPVDDYPIKPKDDTERSYSLEGCVSLLQPPIMEEVTINDKVVKRPVQNLYALSVDPYSKDDSPWSRSVGSIRIVKLNNKVTVEDSLNNNVVARYDGRPATLKHFWNIVFMMAEFYGCKIQSEIQGGGQDGITNARHMKKLHLLRKPVIVGDNKHHTNPKAYFTHMDKEKKNDGLQYLLEWMMEVIAVNEDGTIIRRINYIYDIGFLKECIKYNEEGNFDRVSSMIVMMHEIKDLFRKKVTDRKKKKKTGSFWGQEEWYN